MRIRTRTFILTLGTGLSAGSVIILNVLMVRLLCSYYGDEPGKAMVGTFKQAFLVYFSLAGLLSLQLENSLFYFLPKLGPDRRRALLAQTTMLSMTLAILVAAAMFFGAGAIADFMHNRPMAGLIRILALYPVPCAMCAMVPSFMVCLDRTQASAVYTVVTNVGRVLVTVLLLALHYGLEAAIWGNVIYTAAVAVYGWLDMYRLSGGKARLDRSLILEQLHYCWPLWITVIIGTVGIQFDKLLISRFFDPGTFAVYSYGAMELPVVGMITASLATAMMPNLVILADQGKTHEALDLWQEAGRKCSLLIFPCFVFFLAISRDLMVALFGEGFAMAAWPFSLYLLLLPFRIVIFGGLFRALGKTRPYAISALLGLITDIVVGTALTVAGHGGFLSFIGPAIGMLSTSVLACAYSLNALSKIMHLPISKLMRWKELGRTMLLCLPCGVLILVLPLPFGPQGWLHFPNISAGLYLPCKLIVQAAVFAGAIIAVFFGTRSLKPDEKDLFFMPWRVIRRLGSRTESQEGTVSAGPDGNAPAQAKDANGVNRDA